MLLDKWDPCVKPVHSAEQCAGAGTSHGGGVVQDGGDGPVPLSGGGVEEREASRAAGRAEAGVDGGVAVEVRAAAELLLVHLPRSHGGGEGCAAAAAAVRKGSRGLVGVRRR